MLELANLGNIIAFIHAFHLFKQEIGQLTFSKQGSILVVHRRNCLEAIDIDTSGVIDSFIGLKQNLIHNIKTILHMM
jgi:hypothetical protein